MALSQRDGQQVLREAYDSDNQSLRTVDLGVLVPGPYDEITLTYIVAGDGAGEIGTAVYKQNSTTVGTLTLTYDTSNRLINVIRS